MSKFAFFFSLMILSAFEINAQCRIINNPSLFHEVMRDDFNGSQVDLSEWRVKDSCEHHLFFRPSNVIVSGGLLRLKNSFDPSVINYCTTPKLNGFSSGGLETISSKSFPRSFSNNQFYPNGYMFFEARVKFPSDRGIWPAFWLSGGAGEVDIFEFYHGNSQEAHFTNTTHALAFTSSCSKPWRFPENDFTKWHTFAVAWRVRKNQQDTVDVTYFMDGKELWTQNKVQPEPNKGFGININNGFQDWIMATENEFLVDYISVMESSIEDIELLKVEYYNKLQLNETCAPRFNSIAVGEGNQIFFNHDGWMYTYHFNNNQWKLGYVTQFLPLERISGDIEVGLGNSIFYRGENGKLHKYSWNQNWSHTIINNTLNVASDEGSIATLHPELGNPLVALSILEAESNIKYVNIYQGNGNEYTQLGFNSVEECDGDINFLSEKKIIYRGADGFAHMYTDNNGTWGHSFILNTFGQKLQVRDYPGSITVSQNDPGQFFVVDPNGWVVVVYSSSGNLNYGYLTTDFSLDEAVSVSSNIISTNDTDLRIIYKNKFGQLKDYHFTGTTDNGWSSGTPVQCGNHVASDVMNNICSGPRNIFFFRDFSGKIQSFFWRCCESLNGCQNFPPGNIVFREPLELDTDDNFIKSPADSNGFKFKIFPNPVGETLRISCEIIADFCYQIFDNSGKMVAFGSNQFAKDQIIDVNNLPEGVFIIRIYNDEFSKVYKIFRTVD